MQANMKLPMEHNPFKMVGCGGCGAGGGGGVTDSTSHSTLSVHYGYFCSKWVFKRADYSKQAS